ncbi:hypothetical protein K0M31_017586 [Melipona bicolor]|uniref:Uncharacterized protein n=1 Tax=Melipona bicolor TaxID=60889 RepID=A0AA40G6F2_9HYME|nr:hypothetical protein K0M31_017586 [Melipona bicolor]
MLTARSGPLGLGVPRTLGPAEGSDHLFLLPQRALIMDSTHLRQDLAGLDFNLHLNLLHTAPRGNVWLYFYKLHLPKEKYSALWGVLISAEHTKNKTGTTILTEHLENILRIAAICIKPDIDELTFKKYWYSR